MINTTLALPHALGMEKAVLSVFMVHPHLMDEHSAVTEDHFYPAAHKIIFRHLRAEWQERQTFDNVALVQRLIAANDLDHVGGPAYVSDIYTYAPTPAHLRHHVEKLSEYRARRLAIAAAERLAEAARDDGDDEYLRAAAEPITAIFEAVANASPPRSTKDVLRDCLGEFQKRVRGEVSPMGIDTITEIDEALRGMKPGLVWVIGAYPSGGKSVIAGQIMVDAALAGHPAAIITLEMSERDLMDRCIIQGARVPALVFSDPKAYARENGMENPAHGHLDAISRAMTSIAQAPFYIRRPQNSRLETIIATIRRLHRKHGIKAVAIDYLQRVLVGSGRDSREQQVTEISHAVQALAFELGIHIIVLSQLNAEGETKQGRVIEEDADAFLAIVQDRNRESETYKDHQHILIVKDRHHGTGGTRLPLVLKRDTLRFGYGLPTKPAKAAKPATRFAVHEG